MTRIRLYRELKRQTKYKVSWDRDSGKYHLHWNYYENALEVKTENHQVLIDYSLKSLLRFRPRGYWLRLIDDALKQ